MLIKLILENYIPLLSSGITRVELDLAHMVNIFIAANGTGKSSILKELNPMPPENGNYKAGRKYVELKVGANHYILDSYTDRGDGHSFKLNGKEMNNGGGYTTQKELVWRYFKRLDANLSRVLSGVKAQDLLSMMPVNRRKDIFMHLYPNDTDYAMGVFNRLKTARNELKAQIKNQVTRYAEENRKLETIAGCGVEELEARIRSIENELRQSLLVRGSLEQVKVDAKLREKINAFNQLVDQLAVNRVSGFFETEFELLGNQEILEQLISTHEEQAAVLQKVISDHAGALEGVEEILEDPLVFQHQADQLKDELTNLQTLVNQYNDLLDNYPIFNDKNENLDGLIGVITPFSEALNRVTNASMPELTGGQYAHWTKRLEIVSNELRDLNNELASAVHQLRHYDNAEVIECPDCTHQFKVGMSAKDVAKLRDNKAVLERRLEALQQEKVTLTNQIENDAEWYNSMLALHQFCRTHGDVAILVRLVKEYDIGKADVHILLNALNTFAKRFDCTRRINGLLEEQKLLNTRIGLLTNDTVMDIALYVKGLEEDLAKENRRINFYKNKLRHLMGSLNCIRNYNNDITRLHELREEILKGLENEGLLDLRRRVDERISLLTDEKDDYLRTIITSRSLTAVVASISDDIDRLKKRLVVVETYMDGLCPNKGLIGRLMTDFIKVFCGNMNAVIRAVWNTPLHIKPCNKANGDLTYRFPVVNGDKDPAPDVSDCSAGQTSIIDFAFRFVALNYQGEYPLIMDEVGTAFDEIKRGRFFNFIKEYTQKKDVRQLFLVSHYLVHYGIFTNPNVVAMKYDGLTLPAEPNQHSVII